MAYKYTKIYKARGRRDFCRIGVLNDGEWKKLPLMRTSSASFVRRVIENEVADSFDKLNKPLTPIKHPIWTGDDLRSYRYRSGLNADDFGSILGVCSRTIYSYETSGELPTYIPAALQFLAKKSLVDNQVKSGRLKMIIKDVNRYKVTSRQIKNLRKKLDYTQENLADILFITRKQVGQLENYPLNVCQSLHARYFLQAFLPKPKPRR